MTSPRSHSGIDIFAVSQHISKVECRDVSSNYIGDEALLHNEILDVIWAIRAPAEADQTIASNRIDQTILDQKL